MITFFQTILLEYGFEKFPILDWNEKRIYGNDAINRMLAKAYDLTGNGIFEQAQADTIVRIIDEFDRCILKYILGFYQYVEECLVVVFLCSKICRFFDYLIQKDYFWSK